MAQLIIQAQAQNSTKVDSYMDLQHAKAQTLIRAMKQKDWAFVLAVPTIEMIRHKYCILPVWDVDETGMGNDLPTAKKIGTYVFNLSLVEQKTLLSKEDFAKLVEALKKSREPFRGYIGPVPHDELSYRMTMINDELSVME